MISDVGQKMGWKSYLRQRQLLMYDNLIVMAMVRESISKMKNGNSAGPSELVSQMMKLSVEAGLRSQIIRDGIIPAESGVSTSPNCHQGKEML